MQRETRAGYFMTLERLWPTTLKFTKTADEFCEWQPASIKILRNYATTVRENRRLIQNIPQSFCFFVYVSLFFSPVVLQYQRDLVRCFLNAIELFFYVYFYATCYIFPIIADLFFRDSTMNNNILLFRLVFSMLLLILL